MGGGLAASANKPWSVYAAQGYLVLSASLSAGKENSQVPVMNFTPPMNLAISHQISVGKVFCELAEQVTTAWLSPSSKSLLFGALMYSSHSSLMFFLA